MAMSAVPTCLAVFQEACQVAAVELHEAVNVSSTNMPDYPPGVDVYQAWKAEPCSVLLLNSGSSSEMALLFQEGYLES